MLVLGTRRFTLRKSADNPHYFKRVDGHRGKLVEESHETHVHALEVSSGSGLGVNKYLSKIKHSPDLSSTLLAQDSSSRWRQKVLSCVEMDRHISCVEICLICFCFFGGKDDLIDNKPSKPFLIYRPSRLTQICQKYFVVS